MVATVVDAQIFPSGRSFDAWLGLIPRQHATGGRERLLGISKRGDGYLRRQLMHGAPPGWYSIAASFAPSQTKNMEYSGCVGFLLKRPWRGRWP